ncbi:MAG TPA: hypothetical protein VHC20_08210 [Candidatus Paceibacterota bacterium]|nr:hypothetical protein [Candidatus Paceibacterota bacterium]
MGKVGLVKFVVAACLLWACGGGVDRDAACKNEKQLTEQITAEATQVDGISAQGLCALDQAGIAARLRNGARWSSASDADVSARAQQYVTNCGKVSQAKADCGD